MIAAKSRRSKASLEVTGRSALLLTYGSPSPVVYFDNWLRHLGTRAETILNSLIEMVEFCGTVPAVLLTGSSRRHQRFWRRRRDALVGVASPPRFEAGATEEDRWQGRARGGGTVIPSSLYKASLSLAMRSCRMALPERPWLVTIDGTI